MVDNTAKSETETEKAKKAKKELEDKIAAATDSIADLFIERKKKTFT